MKGRTENAVKNRYNSIMKKEKKKMRKHLENINETSFNSNTSLPSEDVEKEIMKTLLVKKEKKNTQTTSNMDQMEIEGTIDAESVCSEASKGKKDKKLVSKERNVFHLCDLEIEKKGKILFELLKFDFQEEERNPNPFSFPVNPMMASNNGMQSFGALPNNTFNPPGSNPINPLIRSQFLQMNPVINSSQPSLDSMNEISRGISIPNITLPTPNQNNQNMSNFGNINTNNNTTNPSNFPSTNNTNQGTNNLLFNNNNKPTQPNQNFSSMNALPNNNNNKPNFPNPFYGNIITNSFNNFQVPFDPMNLQMNPMMGPMNDPMLNNPMMEQTRAQLNNYYMHKNMELFEQFLLTNNSNVNNYHNFQNLQKMQKASQNHFTPSFNNLNQQYPGMFPPSMQNMNPNMNIANQPEMQLNQNYPATTDSINNNNDQMKFEESKKNLQNNTNPNDNMANIKFPSFIVPNPPVLVNPLLQKIKFEENNGNGSTPNTSNSHDSYRSLASSLASSLNTFGSLSSLSNISEPSPGFNAFNFFLNNQINNANNANNQNNQNNQNNANPSSFQQKNLSQNITTTKSQVLDINQNPQSNPTSNEKLSTLSNLTPPANLSNYNVKDISQFNMLDQNQSQLQFAIINPNKQEIYICGNLNTFKKEDQNMPNLNKPNVRKQTSPRSQRKKNHTTCGMSPRSPSKFQDLSPKARLGGQEGTFGDYANQG